MRILISLILVRLGHCYNILVIFGHPGKSHFDVFKPLFQELGERGHNLTILSHIKSEGQIKNAREVLLSDKPMVNSLDLSSLNERRVQQYLSAHFLAAYADITCESVMQRKSFQNFLKEEHHFDVILVEFFNTNCFYGLINKYKASFIGMYSSTLMAWHAGWFGAPDNPSYIPSMYMGYTPPMTFMQRVENTLVHLAHQLVYKYKMEQPGAEMSKKYIGYEPADPHNASAFFINMHYSFQGVRPLTPGVVEVAGLHMSKMTPKKLPKDIETWTSGAESGLIYFSLGSVAKGHTFPEKQLNVFTKVFSKLSQRIIWKWENETMKNKPDNLKLVEWAPQFDILCHPNTKLFISHGGMLGTAEAIHCGVPILVIPMFADQWLNSEALKRHGAGVVLHLKEATEETLTAALEEALSEKTNLNAQELSRNFRDRLVPPLETAVFWVEHIARHKGGQHVRSAAVDMPLYQYLLLDVFAFLLFIILMSVFTVYKILKLIFKLCFDSKTKVKKA